MPAGYPTCPFFSVAVRAWRASAAVYFRVKSRLVSPGPPKIFQVFFSPMTTCQESGLMFVQL
jgi:hypothetical protein